MRDYQTKSNQGGLPDSITSEKFGAGEANSVLTENKTAVSSSGQSLAPADGTSEETDQLAKAMAIYGAGGASHCIDTGSANAYVLNPVSPKETIPDYFDGMTLSFTVGNNNTGASTVNYANLGVKNITQNGGNALTGGELSQYASIRYSLSDDRFEVVSNYEQLRVFTSSGTYTPSSGVKSVMIISVGGGGGGGGADGQGAATAAAGGGGGGGGSSVSHIVNPDSSYGIVIGSGGGGGSGSGGGAGGSGGSTTVTSTSLNMVASGGGAGQGMTGTTGGNANAGESGVGSGGDLNFNGNDGFRGIVMSSAVVQVGGSGGSIFGGGKRAPNNGTGIAGGFPGGGGSSGAALNVTANNNGGAGADGVVIVKEFF